MIEDLKDKFSLPNITFLKNVFMNLQLCWLYDEMVSCRCEQTTATGSSDKAKKKGKLKTDLKKRLQSLKKINLIFVFY